MKLIIHGNNIQDSRNFYFETKNNVDSPTVVNGENILFDSFFQISEGNTFFEKEKTIFLENLFTLNKLTSTEVKKIIEYINSNRNLNLVFWESSELSKAALNLIKDAEIKSFSIPSQLFVFLDNLKSGNSQLSISSFNNLRENAEEELIWFMIIRQFRLLFSLTKNSKIDEVKRLAPWQISRLKSQALSFGENKLAKIYKKLFLIEEAHKTGKVSYKLGKSIDFFLADL